MTNSFHVNGTDVPLTALDPLRERPNINTKTHKGFQRILSSIRAIGLIESHPHRGLNYLQFRQTLIRLGGWLQLLPVPLAVGITNQIEFRPENSHLLNNNFLPFGK